MEDLKIALDQHHQGTAGPEELLKAAERWAGYAVRSMRKPLVSRALAISAAIAEFVSEYENTGG